MVKKYNGIGIFCDIIKARNEADHFHRNIELDFVIKGHIMVVIEERKFDLNSEEMILIDSNKNHYIHVEDEALICRLNISYEMLVDMLDDEYVMFLCNILTDKDSGYSEIRKIIQEIIYLKMSGDRRDAFRMMERYGQLLDCFIRNYRVSLSDESKQGNMNDAERIRDLLNYINLNYQEPINLAALADQMYVSVSTLSRNFKKATGMKFPDYVNHIRMHYAVSDLLNSNKSITEIAVDNGFSSPSSFNRVFKEMYNISPSQYKKSVRGLTEEKNESLTKEEEAQVRNYLKSNIGANEDEEKDSLVEIRPSNDKKFYNISTKAVTLGAFYHLTNSAVQNQIRQMASQLNLQYLRMWNIFSPQCMIAESPYSKVLSFEIIDIVLDFLVSMNLYPLLDMGCHPNVLIKNNKELFYKKEDRMNFEDLKQWSYFLDKLMEHVVFRYGSDEVSHWIFEITDMPAGEDDYSYYKGNKFSDVYTAAYKIIKSHSPASKVGGPCWVMDGNEVDIKSYLENWKETGFLPDFYSISLFPYKNQEDIRDIYYYDKERNMDPNFLKNQIQEIHRMLEEENAPERPLYVTEITTILSNRNALNDHCGRGTNVLRLTNEFQRYADMICFWVATDRMSLHYAPPDVLHGGSGLMTKDGIPKPSYYALYFLAKMGKNLLAKGEGYIAVENSPNHIYILCYNYKRLKYNYKYEETKIINVYNADSMFEDTENITFSFMIYGLEPDGEYVIKRHIINQEYGSVMDEWKRLGFEPEMRKNDINYLKSVCVPRIQMKRRTAQQGQMMLEAKLSAHEMQLLHIYK